MNKTPNTDQWKLNGDCSKCRRKNYCNNTCKKSVQRRTSIMNKVLHESFIPTAFKGLDSYI